jgi:hypothetical protein
MINLTLALVWGVLAVGLIVYNFTSADPHGRTLLPGSISPGWAAAAAGLLCFYNLARYWNYRVVLAEKQKAEWIARARRGQQSAQAPRPEQVEPNPDFMFGEEPPRPKS